MKLSIAFGGSINDGEGHITAFFEHVNADPILQGAYDGGACALSGGDTRCVVHQQSHLEDGMTLDMQAKALLQLIHLFQITNLM